MMMMMMMMMIDVLVDGGWGDWSSWQPCSASCGEGVELRHRTCDRPRPEHGGRECVGRDTDRRPCRLATCEGEFISPPNCPLIHP